MPESAARCGRDTRVRDADSRRQARGARSDHMRPSGAQALHGMVWCCAAYSRIAVVVNGFVSEDVDAERGGFDAAGGRAPVATAPSATVVGVSGVTVVACATAAGEIVMLSTSCVTSTATGAPSVDVPFTRSNNRFSSAASASSTRRLRSSTTVRNSS